ncbi:hypothetical protein CDV36_016294 [Fusarium kuroshium]|uniref:ribonuclease H n=1 Tax=Fusarium kuroshium TaxID=2010991 RepID=A0A3M2QV51_9HYPO|nr:hypothetical protein CDV36_016294 [Fusarium kuroshium]
MKRDWVENATNRRPLQNSFAIATTCSRDRCKSKRCHVRPQGKFLLLRASTVRLGFGHRRTALPNNKLFTTREQDPETYERIAVEDHVCGHSQLNSAPPTPISRGQMIQFVCHNDPKKVVTYAYGACTNNGQLEPSAGWAVVCGTPGNDDKSCIVSGRLEDKGPFGNDSVAISDRAELRAAIVALCLCDWRDQGYDSIVIATDSTYVVDGATGWAKGWVRKGWKTRTGGNVKNKDLWDLLLGGVERWDHQGMPARNGAAKVELEDIVLGSSQTTTVETEPGSQILALCLEYKSLFDACFGSLVSHITSKAKMERATTPEAALTILDQDSPPSIILVVNGGFARQRKVWERVIDRLREGHSGASRLFQQHGERGRVQSLLCQTGSSPEERILSPGNSQFHCRRPGKSTDYLMGEAITMSSYHYVYIYIHSYYSSRLRLHTTVTIYKYISQRAKSKRK